MKTGSLLILLLAGMGFALWAVIRGQESVQHSLEELRHNVIPI